MPALDLPALTKFLFLLLRRLSLLLAPGFSGEIAPSLFFHASMRGHLIHGVSLYYYGWLMYLHSFGCHPSFFSSSGWLWNICLCIWQQPCSPVIAGALFKGQIWLCRYSSSTIPAFVFKLLHQGGDLFWDCAANRLCLWPEAPHQMTDKWAESHIGPWTLC